MAKDANSAFSGAPEPSSAPAVRKSLMPRLSFLWRFLRPYKLRMTLALVSLLAASGAMLAIFGSLRLVVDKGFSAQNPSGILPYFLMVMGIAAIAAIATAARFYFVTMLGERVVADIREAVHAKAMTLSPNFYEVNKPSEIASRLTADTTLIQTVVGSSLSVALRSLLNAVGGLLWLAIINPFLFAVILVVMPVTVAPIILMSRKVRIHARKAQDRIADVGSIADEGMNAINIVQAFTHEAEEAARYKKAVEDAYNTARIRVIYRSILTFLAIGLIFGGIVFLLYRGAVAVVTGQMTGGELTSLVGLSVFVAASVGGLTDVLGDFQKCAGATERLKELLETEPDIKAPAHPVALPVPPRGDVRFDNLTFYYPSKPHTPALENFNLHVKPGETVALVGPSGAGKTTVMQLILRFYDPASGAVLMDGVDLKAADPREVRRRLAIVPQETVIFGDTAMENIRYGRPDAADEDVFAAARAAAVDDFVRALPEGYGAFLGEKGVRLSGGQRQRIAIARALLRDAPVLLLDEATSALDSESERLVQDALEVLMRGRTTIVIAHRLATVRNADRIVVLDGGRIVAEGRHEELMAAGGLYARLAALQFKAEEQ